MNYFVTAIGTDSGKTVLSAVLVEALHADYWKPVQAGMPRDTETVRALVSNTTSRFYSEGHLLKTPASPHASAKIDGVDLSISSLHPPVSNRDLVIEGAGGVMVPLNDTELVIEMADHFDAEIIVVCNLYLGSINHSLLTLDYLGRTDRKVRGIIFNGESNSESEEIILKKYPYPCLLRMPQLKSVDQASVKKYAEQMKNSMK